MKLSVSLLFMLTCHFLSFSKIVDVSRPYSSDSLIFSSYEFDTINFSNEVKVYPCFFSATVTTGSGSYEYCAIAIENYSKAGYKYLKKAGYEDLKSVSESYAFFDPENTTRYYSNSDTDWIESKLFPDSSVQLDTIVSGNVVDTDFVGYGKWIIQLDNNGSLVYLYYESALKGYNIITYINTNHNNMKMQICDMSFRDTVINPGAWKLLRSMKLRWAVDSLGNGIFNVPTHTCRDFYHDKTSYKNINSKFKTGFYSLLGKKITNVNYSYRLSNGVYLYYSQNKTKPQKSTLFHLKTGIGLNSDFSKPNNQE